jgi:putative hydrolase of HD superfamily
MSKEEKTLYDHVLNRGLAHVIRFNSHPQHFPESVAEHSFYVVYFTNILVSLLKDKGVDISRSRAMQIALVHDMEEMFSGDILTPFKHYNEVVSTAIRKVNEEMIPDAFEGLPENMQKRFVEFWNEDAKQETIEAQVVKIADKLALISKCYEEMKVGNGFFEEIYSTQVQKLYEREEDWWRSIRDDVFPEIEKEA